jgi:hypothetical protein
MKLVERRARMVKAGHPRLLHLRQITTQSIKLTFMPVSQIYQAEVLEVVTNVLVKRLQVMTSTRASQIYQHLLDAAKHIQTETK